MLIPGHYVTFVKNKGMKIPSSSLCFNKKKGGENRLYIRTSIHVHGGAVESGFVQCTFPSFPRYSRREDEQQVGGVCAD